MNLVITHEKILKDCTDEQLLKIKEDLTLDNPKYAQALRYSKYSRVNIPKYLYYYSVKEDGVHVPVGYKVPFNIENADDQRKERTVAYPRILITLREAQQEAYSAYISDTDKGLICLPTGVGKSILGIYIAYALKQKTLILVNKDDLVTGWRKDIDMCFSGKANVGLIKAKSRIVGQHFTIATIQTLSRMTSEEFNKYSSEFGLVIIDECHHLGAEIFNKVLGKFNSPYKIGLTATPERADNLDKVFNLYLGDYAYVQDKKKSNDAILNVEVITRQVTSGYVPKVRKISPSKYVWDDKKGDLYITDIEYSKRPRVPIQYLDNIAIQENEVIIRDICNELNQGHSILVLLSQKHNCRLMREKLIQEGISEKYIQLYYGDSKEPKQQLMSKAESQRKLITIATLSVATEGTNVKQWEILFLASSIASEKNLEQAIGRIRRKATNKISPVRVYDYRYYNIYMLRNHGRKRDNRYKKLGLLKQSITSRGYKK